ncbi:hypothetical protein D3C78_1324800 [compost metagenome]
MQSAPPARAMSASPSRMPWAAVTIDCRPEPHRRFTVRAVDCSLMPLFRATTREMYMSTGSVWMTLPNTTWPTSSPFTWARCRASRATMAPRSLGEKSFRLPPKSPMAVRAPLTMTTSR